MIDSYLWVFVPAIILLTLTPGIDTLLVIRNTARGGWRDGLATSVAICCGLFVHASLSALGISLLLLQSAWLFGVVKLAGAGYLIWLGVKSLRLAFSGKPGFRVPEISVQRRDLPLVISLREGFLSNVLNPKAIIFYMAFLPQFIYPGEPALIKSLFLAAIHFVFANLWQLMIVLFTVKAYRWLNHPRIRTGFNGLTGFVMIGLGLKLGFER